MQGPQVLLTQQSAAVTVTPGTAALTLTAFAPVVSTPRLVTVGVAALTITTFAPAVATPRLVTIGKASLVLTTFAPVVTATSGVTVMPGTDALTLTGFAPTVTGGGAQGSHRVGPRFIRLAPKVAQPVQEPVIATPAPASLRLIASAPTVTVNDDDLALILAA